MKVAVKSRVVEALSAIALLIPFLVARAQRAALEPPESMAGLQLAHVIRGKDIALRKYRALERGLGFSSNPKGCWL